MSYRVFLLSTEAVTYESRCCTAKGYPKDGTDVGGGIHVPRALSRTIRHAVPVKHSKLLQWAVPALEILDSADRDDLKLVSTVEKLDGWTDAPLAVKG